MRQSQLFTKARKESPKDEVSKNAQLLIRAGYINKEMAGVYSYLPLGLKVLHNIANIIREEMDAIGGQEVFLTTLQDPEAWKKSGRWSDEVVDDWFKTKLKNGNELSLAFTHEEPLTKLMTDHINSYKNLPVFVYQIQTKFRNELRSKSGLMRGREFLMKDMYSFMRSQEDTEAFHEKATAAYMNIFNRVGLGDRTFITHSNGGSFSKYSYEFQTLSDAGEDVIHLSREHSIAINDDDYSPELLKDFNLEGIEFEKAKSTEVGDIYKLGTRFSEALGLTFKNEEGKEEFVNMGSYGMGVSRVMGTVVEVLSDERGIVWPREIAPYTVHLLKLGDNEYANELYKKLIDAGIEVLYDDRNVSAGEKFVLSDLLGLPFRVIVGREARKDLIELVERGSGEVRKISEKELLML